ncbi:thiaminase II [Amorphus orientalis]|uniref:Aminopyrimidine aminohydrolase n=1 Tax=Amorphus orientalis TaxID=649198 RepID=A0AAE3VT38_9HYPH|nr:thiaminase II [Amorphus orientalis]MDQ0317690.1 thiaminase/transcriptional activator TenA [Amorphus orientalis]
MEIFERLKAAVPDDWNAYVGHPFVRGMGDGTLPEPAFRHYLVQDYLFLIQFARAYALAGYKARSLADLKAASAGVSAIVDTEMDLHVRLSERWGLSAADLESAVEARATVAYTRLVLEAGMSGDLLDLYTALAPCMIGYAEIGTALAALPGGLSPDNPYREWIAEYSGEGFQEAAQAARDQLDRLAADRLTEARWPALVDLFRQATRLEADFWEMGLTLAE